MNLFELVAVLTLSKKDYEEGLNDAEKEASSFGDKLKSGLGTVAKVGGASLAVVGAGATMVTKSLINTSSEVAQLGDHIDKQSQKIGISAKAYQEWDFILTHSGASVDGLQTAMKTLSSQAEEQAEEFQKLGISQEEVARLSPEELFERTIKALQEMDQSTERTAITSKLLGRSATELGPVLNATSDDIESMRQQAHDLGKVLSDESVKSAAAYEDSLYNLQTSIGGIKNRLGVELLPAITNVMDGLTGVFSGDDSAIEKVAQGIGSLADRIAESIPKMGEMATKLITTFGKAIIRNLPQIAKSAVQIVKSLLGTITENLPLIMDIGMEVMMTLIDGIIDSLPQVIDGLIQLIVRIIDKLPEIIIKLVEALPRVIQMVIEGLVTNLPVIIEGLINLVLELINHLPEIMLGFIQALPDIIQMIVTGLLNNLPLLVQGAIQMVVGLVTHLPEIISGLIGAIPDIISTIVGAFGPLGGLLGDVFGGALDIAGGILEELGNIAQGVFNWIGTLMDDPAKALEEAFDGIKNYATKVFESVKTIITGVFDLIDAKQKEAEAKARKEKTDAALQAEIDAGKLKAETNEQGTHDYTDEYRAYLTAKGLLGDGSAIISEDTTWEQWQSEPKYQEKKSELDVTGEITIKGVNDKNEFVGASQMTEEQLARMFQTQGRLY